MIPAQRHRPAGAGEPSTGVGVPPTSVDDPPTRAALAAQAGDQAAATMFVRITQAEVWRFTAALVGPQAADDVTQDTYLRAFRALADFQARASARTWLLGIARRACADHLRTVVRRRRLDTTLADQAHHRPAPDHAGFHGTADLITRLAPERQVAFVLTQLLGLSYEQAAAVEEVPIGTIRSRVARARHELIDAVDRARAS